MDKNKKAEVKKILLATAGGIICISTSILLGKKIKSKKLKSINPNLLELCEEGLYTFIDMDADQIVCTIDTDNAARFMELLTKAENFIAENQAF